MPLKHRFFIFFVLLVQMQASECLFFFSPPIQKKPITLMINPAGDAQHTGRKIDDTFERSVTLQLAEQIKKSIEELYLNVTVLFTRMAGDTVAPLQSASFCNRMNADFYMSIHCYHQTESKPTLALYQFSYGDTFITKQFDLALIPYDQAHIGNAKTSTCYGGLIKEVLSQNVYTNLYTLQGIFTMPFKSLIGVQAPSIALEIGIKQKDSWRLCVEPIVASLAPIIEKLS